MLDLLDDCTFPTHGGGVKMGNFPRVCAYAYSRVRALFLYYIYIYIYIYNIWGRGAAQSRLPSPCSIYTIVVYLHSVNRENFKIVKNS